MHSDQKPLLVSIVGPTAVGKTDLAIKVAQHFKTEIISADSRQFFRELEIGTAKPSMEELEMVPHHFINSHAIAQAYNAGAYERDALELIKTLSSRHKLIVAVGGSTLYLKALWEGFDEMPEIDNRIRQALNHEFAAHGLSGLLEELKAHDPDYYREVDIHNGQRIIRALEVIRSTGKPFSAFRVAKKKSRPYRNLKIGLNMTRELLFDRINKRMDQMIKDGLFEEAESLLVYQNHHALKTVGYTEIFNHLNGVYDRDEAIHLLKRNSRRYAKRQLTWFNRYDDIHWFAPKNENEILRLIEANLSDK